jgi:hypothetical protein
MNAERIIALRDIHQPTARAVIKSRACRVAQRIAVQPAPAAHERLRGRKLSHPTRTTAQAEGTEQ